MKFSIRVLCIFCLLITFLGCGGMGNNGSTSPIPSGLTYVTNWAENGRVGNPAGQSQRVSIIDNRGITISTALLQTTSSNADSINFDLPTGTYTIKSELFSGSNAGNTLTGVFQRTVTLPLTAPINTRVGSDVNSISVSPSATIVRQGAGTTFSAEGISSDGTPTFIDPNSITWTVLGGVGNIQSTGVFTATTVGTGSVRATHTASGRLGSAGVTVTTNTATRSKWTVLVYMNAASDLQPYSLTNMNQMERVAQNPEVRFVVQWKQARINLISPNPTFEGTRRYLVKPELTSAIGSELIQDLGNNVDAGRTETLRDFIQWGKTNYPADRYVLVMWSHGNGWRKSLTEQPSRAVSFDDQTGSAIQIWQFDQAFGTEQFDILAWDASLMQMMEVAYEARNNARYVIGSEESPPGEGYPYDLIFSKFRDNPDDTTVNLSRHFVTETLNYPLFANRKITQSVIDTTRLPALATAMSTLGTELKNNATSMSSIIQSARTASQTYSQSGTRYFRDLYDLCVKLETATTPTGVVSALTAVKTAQTNAIVWEGSNAQSPNSHGISIDFSPASVFTSSATNYGRMKFAIDTQWDEFLIVAP